MSVYRTIEDSIWSDPWYEALKPAAKLVFLYLMTNPRQTPCGAFEISPGRISAETGLDGRHIAAAMAELVGIGKVAWWADLGWVFVVRFYKRQRALSSDKFAVAARKAVAALPAVVGRRVSQEYPDLAPIPASPLPPVQIPTPYPIDRVSAVTATESETESAGETATGTAPPAPARDEAVAPAAPTAEPKYPPAFLAFWTAYPRKENKPEALKAWKSIRPDGDTADAIVAGVDRWQQSDQWARKVYQHASTWLNGRQWEDEPMPATEAAPARASPNGKSTQRFNELRDFAAQGLETIDDRNGLAGGHDETVHDVAYTVRDKERDERAQRPLRRDSG